jgi:uncharacterized protein (DUF302 family)
MSQGSTLVVHRSPFSYDETLTRLRHAMQERGLQLFAQVDHAANARGVGLDMPATMVLVFGDPTQGTPLMVAHPDFALELPSRLVVREDPDGSVSVLHHEARLLGERYGLAPEVLEGLASLVRFIDVALGIREG